MPAESVAHERQVCQAKAIPAMSHFEREAKIDLWLPVAPLLIGLLVTVLAVFACGVVEETRIDRCLDQGGSYDYESKECDFSVSHPSLE